VEEQKLTASDGAEVDHFGYAVAVSGDVVVVGSYWDDDNGHASGSAYVFRHVGSTWVEEQKLTANDGAENDRFGVSVAVSGDAAVVGAYFGDGNSPDSGSAYVYRDVGGTWVEEQELTARDGDRGDEFGHAVAVSGDAAVIGAPWHDGTGLWSGSAYLYRHVGGAWVEERELVGSDVYSADWSGRSVAVSGDVAVVGADGDDDDGWYSGSAYAFTGLTSVSNEETEEALPVRTLLSPPVPNPTRGTMSLRYALERTAPVRLRVVDAFGRSVVVRALGQVPAGAHEVALDLRALPAGVYALRLEAEGHVETQRVTIIH
jgi:hypothetical protein